jgi:hypothetical protein
MTKEKLDAFMDTALYDLSSEVGMGEYSFYVDPERGGRILKQFYDKICDDQRNVYIRALENLENHPDINVNVDNAWVKLSVAIATISGAGGNKELCSDPLPVQQPPDEPYPMIKCKKCGIVIGDNGYGYCEPCYFDLPTAQVKLKLNTAEDVGAFMNITNELSSFRRGRADAVRECVAKLKEAWVNTNGKYDVNKAVAVVEAVGRKYE